MLYLITLDGVLVRVVDTPIDLERAGPWAVRAMCRDLAIPLHSLEGQSPVALAIRPDMITPWAPERAAPIPPRARRKLESGFNTKGVLT